MENALPEHGNPEESHSEHPSKSEDSKAFTGETGPEVSIILPSYNERGNIIELIQEIQNALEGISREILVVDDNSPDGTAEAVTETFRENPEVKVFVRKTDPSLAKSIRKGIEEAQGRKILVMDTDFNHQPIYLPFMVHFLEFYDFVMGSRFVYGGLMNSRFRHLLSWTFNIFVRLATGGMVTDNLYGFFGARRSVLDRYEARYNEIFQGFGEYFIRLLYYLQHDNISILQFPAVNGDRRSGQGTTSFFRTFRTYFWATLRFTFRKKIRK